MKTNYFGESRIQSALEYMYWPADTLLVANVAREAKSVAHPWYKV